MYSSQERTTVTGDASCHSLIHCYCQMQLCNGHDRTSSIPDSDSLIIIK